MTTANAPREVLAPEADSRAILRSLVVTEEFVAPASYGAVTHDGSLKGDGSAATPLGVSIAPTQPTLRILTTEGGAHYLDVVSATVCALGLPTFNSGDGTKVAFFGSNGTTQPEITGSRSDGTALANLLTALAAMGLIIDGTGP